MLYVRVNRKPFPYVIGRKGKPVVQVLFVRVGFAAFEDETPITILTLDHVIRPHFVPHNWMPEGAAAAIAGDFSLEHIDRLWVIERRGGGHVLALFLPDKWRIGYSIAS